MLGAALLVAGGVAAWRTVDARSVASQQQQLADLAAGQRDIVGAWAESRRLAARTVAAYPTTEVVLGARTMDPLPFSPAEGGARHLRTLLEAFRAQSGCVRASVFDAHGARVVTTDERPTSSTDAALVAAVVARRATVVSDEIVDGVPVACVGAPVMVAPDGPTCGVVVLHDELPGRVAQSLSQRQARAREAEICLVALDTPPRVLAGLPPEARPPGEAGAAIDPTLLAAIPAEVAVSSLVADDGGGEPWVVGFARLPDTPWAFVARLERAVVVRDGRRIVVAVGGALLCAVLGLVLALRAGRSLRQARDETAAAAQARRFADALDRSDQVATFLGADGIVHEARGAVRSVLGAEVPVVVGRRADEMLLPTDRRAFAAALEAASTTGHARIEATLSVPGGVDRPVEVGVSRLVGEAGHLVTWTDSSERRAAESRLRESEEAHRLLFDANPSPMWVYDAETLRILAVNDAATRVYGYPRAEMLELTIRDVRPPDEQARLDAMRDARRFPGDGAAHASEWRHRARDGTEFPVRVVSREIVFRGRRARLVLAEDLRERRAAEDTARTLARALEQSPLAVVITDREGRIEYANPTLCALTGYTLEEAIGANPRILRSEQTPPEVHADLWRTIAAGKVWHGEFVNRRKDGTTYPAAATIGPVLDPTGHVTHYVGIQEDLTFRRGIEARATKAEAQLAQAQKLEAIGHLAGGVAHDFNNLLCVILGFGQLALASLDREHPAVPKLEQVVDAGRKAEALTRQLLAFSRRQVLQPRVVDVGTTVRDLEKMLRRLLGEDVVLETVVEAGLPVVLVDPGQLEQVVINLAVNARDAMPRGGRLRIGVRSVDVLEPAELQGGRLEPGPHVVVDVADDGCGMDAATQAHVFEPFFTTKPAGKGTGLGLATVHGIVRQSGGTIGFESAPGRGTTFHVWLPRLARVPDGAAAGTTDLAQFAGKERVLVVEDQEPVRRLVSVWLEALGYRVVLAGDGVEALAWADGALAPADALLTDVVMPVMSGRELAERLVAKWPSLRVVYMSGYTADVVAERGVLPEGMRFVEKPLDEARLLRALRAALDAPAAPAGDGAVRAT